MFVLPFQVDFRLVRLPLVTLIVMLLCLGIYLAQSHSDSRWRNARAFACDHADETLRGIWSGDDAASNEAQCAGLLAEISRAPDPQAQIAEIADAVASGPDGKRLGGRDAITRSLADFWKSAERLGGNAPLTPGLTYTPASWNPWRMITATLAHAGWGHLLGNLFFFYLFAATVEGILGAWRFTAFLIVLALGTHAVYSLASLGTAAPPTLGLSGIVYGAMGLFAYFLPDARIRSFVWIVVHVRVTHLSAWFVALWYIGGDAVSLLFHGNHGGINLIAHVSGAVIAVLLGMTLLRDDRDWVRLEARPHLQPYV